MLRMELPEKRKWGRPKMRFMDAVRERGLGSGGSDGGDIEDRTKWRWKIRCGNP